MNLLESLKYLVGLKPDPVVKVTWEGDIEEEFIFQPNQNMYVRAQKLLLHAARLRSLSNAEALFDVVIEEARRLKNATGDNMTVIFYPNGGEFFTNDKNRDNQDVWKFDRKWSDEYLSLAKVVGKTGSHADLLRWMAEIQNSVVDYGSIYSAMRRFRVDKKVEITSQPRLIDGKNGNDLSISFQIAGENGGAGKAQFPADLVCKLPVISMSSMIYEVPVEVDSWLDERSLCFMLRCPGLEAVRRKAVLDEITLFKAKAKAALPELLIVTDL